MLRETTGEGRAELHKVRDSTVAEHIGESQGNRIEWCPRSPESTSEASTASYVQSAAPPPRYPFPGVNVLDTLLRASRAHSSQTDSDSQHTIP